MHKDITLEVLPNPNALAETAFNLVRDAAEEAKAEGRIFRIAFSGGSTPKRLFALIKEKAAQGISVLSDAEIFFVDDRWVPEKHSDNNAAMAWKYLGQGAVSREHFYPMPTTGATPEEDAAIYQKILREKYGSETLDPKRPLFDVVMLGIGTDGHTASLFPDTPILREMKDWVGTCMPKTAPHQRITLTYPAIASARNTVFLIEGASKAEMLSRLLAGDESIPSGRVQTEGKYIVMADLDATNAL